MTDPTTPPTPPTTPPADGGRRLPRFPYLEAMTQAVDRLGHDTEMDAKKFVEEEVTAVETLRRVVMAKARQHLQDRRDVVMAVKDALDKLNAALGDNSSDRPPQG